MPQHPHIPPHMRQGTAFHEIITLPTLAPNLARPYFLPGTPEYYAAQAQQLREAGIIPDGTAAAPEGEKRCISHLLQSWLT